MFVKSRILVMIASKIKNTIFKNIFCKKKKSKVKAAVVSTPGLILKLKDNYKQYN